MILGEVSGGAGGGRTSDLASATMLVLRLDRKLGLGVCGNLWRGPADPQRLTPEERDRVRAKCGQSERRARELLKPRRDLIEAVAARLVETRELAAEEVADLLGDLESGETH
ncbi:AAA ATPase [Rhodovulum sulfidophilum]|uniref:AAA ATPase n=1 Tax=Rhodovulum sulfidophilum TaxID=35806 RepID=A0A0D6B8C9_RHOSU|nr:AAA ATPase [Rhodovulum sulfidophilum]